MRDCSQNMYTPLYIHIMSEADGGCQDGFGQRMQMIGYLLLVFSVVIDHRYLCTDTKPSLKPRPVAKPS